MTTPSSTIAQFARMSLAKYNNSHMKLPETELSRSRPAAPELTHKNLVSEELWTRLVSRIVKETDHDANGAARVMDQALGFLHLVALDPNGKYSPSPAVDVGWHTFLMYTRQYMEFGARVAGRFIHHSPLDAEGTDQSNVDLNRTVEAMHRFGLAVDYELWVNSAGITTSGRCDTCIE